jgi:hypothetical protein
MLEKDRIAAGENRREAYRVLVRESERLRRLVESLLDFGHLEAQSFRYRLEAVDASEIIHGVVEEFRAKATSEGYRVEFSESTNQPLVHADHEALGLAVWNLLDNAVKYSPECRTVWVELGREEERVAIRVKDLGMGIPGRRAEADLPQVRPREAAGGKTHSRDGHRACHHAPHRRGAPRRDTASATENGLRGGVEFDLEAVAGKRTHHRICDRAPRNDEPFAGGSGAVFGYLGHTDSTLPRLRRPPDGESRNRSPITFRF